MLFNCRLAWLENWKRIATFYTIYYTIFVSILLDLFGLYLVRISVRLFCCYLYTLNHYSIKMYMLMLKIIVFRFLKFVVSSSQIKYYEIQINLFIYVFNNMYTSYCYERNKLFAHFEVDQSVYQINICHYKFFIYTGELNIGTTYVANIEPGIRQTLLKNNIKLCLWYIHKSNLSPILVCK